MSAPKSNDGGLVTRQRSATLTSDSPLPEQAPRRARSCFTCLPDGHYVEPFHPNLVDYNTGNRSAGGGLLHSEKKLRDRRATRSRARETELSATVVCVRRAPQNILVRFMPREEWVQIKRKEEVLAVKSGRGGETSEHLVASPMLRTMPGPAPATPANTSCSTAMYPLPRLVQEPAHTDGTAESEDDCVDEEDGERSLPIFANTTTDVSLTSMSQSTATSGQRRSAGAGAARSVRFVPWSCYANESVRAADASLSEPLVYDYFVPPENVAAKVRHDKHSSLTGYVKHKFSHSRHQMEAMEKEYRRSYLAVERRNIFLWQFQRDLQARLHRDPTYVVGRVVPEEFMQTFFLLREEQSARLRYEARQQARNPEEAERLLRQVPQHLFSLDHTFSQLPFAGQASSDGLVVVSIGDPSSANRLSLFAVSDDDDDDDNAPFVPHRYGTATYTRRTDCAGSPLSSATSMRTVESTPTKDSRAPSVTGADLSLSSAELPPTGSRSGSGIVSILTTSSGSSMKHTKKAAPSSPPVRTTTVPASPLGVQRGRPPQKLQDRDWSLREDADSPLATRGKDRTAAKPTPPSSSAEASPSPSSLTLAPARTVAASASRREPSCSLTSGKPASCKSQPCL